MEKLSTIFVLLIISSVLIVSNISAASANSSISEDEKKIRELIDECSSEIDGDASKTDLEKKVAKKTCETEIRNDNTEFNNDHKDLAEKKIRLENVEKCQDWYPQFTVLPLEKFRLYKSVELVSDCIMLYKDSIWQYSESDRLEVLAEKLIELRTRVEDVTDDQPTPVTFEDQTIQPNIILKQNSDTRIAELEEKVKSLQNELDKKDQVIKEQLKVILDLADRIKNVVSSHIGSFLIYF